MSFVAPRYNRSKLMSFYDLPYEEQIELTKDLNTNEDDDQKEINQIHDDTYIEFHYPDRKEYLPLSNFMRFDFANGTPNKIWDGYYASSAFNVILIKYNQECDGVLVAEKFSQ